MLIRKHDNSTCIRSVTFIATDWQSVFMDKKSNRDPKSFIDADLSTRFLVVSLISLNNPQRFRSFLNHSTPRLSRFQPRFLALAVRLLRVSHNYRNSPSAIPMLISNSEMLCPLLLRSSITSTLLPSGPTSTVVSSGTIWLCTLGLSIAAEMFKPHSRLRITWARAGKMREPPDPPRTA